jgi:TrmH family RNA methyltransferase
MQRIAGVESVAPGALAAEVALPPPAPLLGAPQGSLTRVLVLDGVQDPGNLGTLLRTALALGWQAAVLLPGCCDPFNDKALRASRGAAFKLPLAQMSLQQWQQLVQEQGLLALAAEPDRAAAGAATLGGGGSGGGDGAAGSVPAERPRQQRRQLGQSHGNEEGLQEGASDLADVQPRPGRLPVCLCLGAEGRGLSPELLQHCRVVSIPQSGGAALMESLNVSAAGAILMFALSDSAALLLSELADL